MYGNSATEPTCVFTHSPGCNCFVTVHTSSNISAAPELDEPLPHELRQWRPPAGEPGLELAARTDRRHATPQWREWAHARRFSRQDRAPPVLLAA